MKYAIVFIALLLVACNTDVQKSNSSVSNTSGRALFTNYCSVCHGKGAIGSNQGPPLVHKIYEPSHHSDKSFYLAAKNGVRAHHWQFGNMPAITNVTRADMEKIITYVRRLQRKAGIR